MMEKRMKICFFFDLWNAVMRNRCAFVAESYKKNIISTGDSVCKTELNKDFSRRCCKIKKIVIFATLFSEGTRSSMDRISDSGSDDASSILAEFTKTTCDEGKSEKGEKKKMPI